MKRVTILVLIGVIVQIYNYLYAIESSKDNMEETSYSRMALTNLSSFKYKKLSTTQYETGGISYRYSLRDKFRGTAEKVCGDSILTDTLFFDYVDSYVRVILSFPIPTTVQKEVFEDDCTYFFVNQDNGAAIGIGNGKLIVDRNDCVILSETECNNRRTIIGYRLNKHNEKKYFCEIKNFYPINVRLMYESVKESDVNKYDGFLNNIKVDVIYRKDK